MYSCHLMVCTGEGTYIYMRTNSSESCSGFCRQFITQMARQLVSASYSSLLVLIKVHSFQLFFTLKQLYITFEVLENVEHCGGEPEQAGYYGYMDMNKLSFTLK